MTLRTSSDRLSEALLQATRHWDTRRHAVAMHPGEVSVPHSFTIAISREVGAGGTSVARAVGQRLGWQVYDQELVDMIAQKMGLRANLLESVDERRLSWLRECVAAFSGSPFVSEGGYVHHLLQTLFSLNAHGECVIVGRGAALVLPPVATLRVRLIATAEDRIKTLSRELGLSRNETLLHIEKADRERVDFVTEHFAKDPCDAKHYDLVLNTSRFGVAGCAELILAALERLHKERDRTSSAELAPND